MIVDPLKRDKIASRIREADGKVVRKRLKILMRRDRIERTGTFVKMTLAPDKSFEEALEYLPRERPIPGGALEKRLTCK